jgi:hypothetical protein
MMTATTSIRLDAHLADEAKRVLGAKSRTNRTDFELINRYCTIKLEVWRGGEAIKIQSGAWPPRSM